MAQTGYFYLLLLFTFPLTVLSEPERRSILDTIMTTMNHAKTYFDIAKDVTNLVSQSFNLKSKTKGEMKNLKTDNEHSSLKHSFINGFFRMLKLDSSKVIAIAVNSVIFLAQLISTLFDMKANGVNPMEEPESKTAQPNWDPLKYIMEHQNERVQRLVKQAQDPDLPNKLIQRAEGYDSSCVRLLICKMSPIIRAAQKSLTDKSVFKNRKMTSWLPSWSEFEDNSDNCEDRHADCNLFPD